VTSEASAPSSSPWRGSCWPVRAARTLGRMPHMLSPPDRL